MTNYNERLDEILVDNFEEIRVIGCTVECIDRRIAEAKQAITTLIKELVEEAKPAEKDQQAQSTLDDESRCRFYRYGGYNFAINEFEQNLLKAL